MKPSTNALDVIVIVGKPGSGKTTLARTMADALGWNRWSIDQERARGGSWRTYPSRVVAMAPVVAESVIFPLRFRRALGARALVIACHCDERTRVARQLARRAPAGPSPYDYRDVASVVVDTAGRARGRVDATEAMGACPKT